MMVKPPVTDLLKKVDSRYKLVIAVSKRARQLADGATPLTGEIGIVHSPSISWTLLNFFSSKSWYIVPAGITGLTNRFTMLHTMIYRRMEVMEVYGGFFSYIYIFITFSWYSYLVICVYITYFSLIFTIYIE